MLENEVGWNSLRASLLPRRCAQSHTCEPLQLVHECRRLLGSSERVETQVHSGCQSAHATMTLGHLDQ